MRIIEYIFPILLIVLQFAAALVYSFLKDVWMAGYFFAATILNVCVIMK